MRTITITSGKGGVGKTNISANLALELAAAGQKTCLFDADLGLANINILLAVETPYTLEDALNGTVSFEDIVLRDFHGVDIIPGSSGVEKLANLGEEQLAKLTRDLSALDGYDIMVVDTSAGVSRSVIAFCMASSEVILVITPEPTSMTDSYALLKLLCRKGFEGAVRTVVNQARNVASARKIYQTFRDAVGRFLQVDIQLLGVIVHDKRLLHAVTRQEAVLLLYPDTNASKCIKHFTKTLLSLPETREDNGNAHFWARCLRFLTGQAKTSHWQPEAAAPDSKPREEHCRERAEQRTPEREAAVIEGEKPPKALNHGEHGKEHELQEALPSLIQRLIESVSTVSSELHQLRVSVEERRVHFPDESRVPPVRAEEESGDDVVLDFRTFLTQRGIQPRKQNHESKA